MIDPKDLDPWTGSRARIKVLGVGGGGGNAINRMIEEGIEGVEFIAINTDVQVLSLNKAEKKVQIGPRTTGGLGAGSFPEIGRKSAEESKDDIRRIVEGADLIFITAGMGGGTGTGACPIIASVAQELEILTVAVVTKPFSFEGKSRMRVAEDGISELTSYVDTIITISNDRLLKVVDKNTPLNEAFRVADNVLLHAVKSISELITKPGLVNLDFADVRTILKDGGTAWFGIGAGRGENRAKEAALKALSSPLLDFTITGASKVLYNITGALNIGEVNEIATYINENLAEVQDAKIIFGAVPDEELKDEIRVSVIAAGFSTIPEETKREKVFPSKEEVFNESDFEIPAFLRKRNKR